MLSKCITYLKPLSEVSPLEVVVSIGVKSQVDEEPGQLLGVHVSTHTVLHATRELLVVYNDGYGSTNKGYTLSNSTII